ncbi:MAG: potassium efflux system protein [Planctomycetota bacterium]|jgi:potassium efflux system protein
MRSRFVRSAGRLVRYLTALLISASLFTGAAEAQEPEVPKVEFLEALLQEAEASGAPGHEEFAQAYRQAIAALKAASVARARANSLTDDAAGAPGLIEALRSELAEPFQMVGEQEIAGVSLTELEGRFKQAQAELSVARTKVGELEKLAEYRANRKGEFPEEVTSRQALVNGTLDALAALPSDPENEARRWLLLSSLDEHRAVLTALETERDTYEARRELLPLRRDRAARAVTIAERTATFLKEKVDARRAQEGDAAAQEAEQLVEDITRRFPALLEVAAINQSLAELRSGENGLPRRISSAQAKLDTERALLDETNRRFRAARRRITAGGLTEGMAGTLRKDHEWLASETGLRRTSNERVKLLSNAQLEMIAIEEQRVELGDPTSAAEALLGRLGLATPEKRLREAAHELVSKQREAQDAALDDYSLLTSVFYEHREISTQFESAVRTYRAYIEKHILWVRSTILNPTPSLLQVPAVTTEVIRQLSAEFNLDAVWRVVREKSGACVSFAIAILALFIARPLLRRKREEIGAKVRSFKTDGYFYTVRALVQTFLLALPGPFAVWFIGSMVAASPEGLLRALGGALGETAIAWLVLRVIAGLIVENGVGQSHFKWPVGSCGKVAAEFRWFEPIGVVLGLAVLFLDKQGVVAWSNSLGRLCFVLLMISLSLLLHRLLREESKIWVVHPKTGKKNFGKTHRTWSFLAAAIPVGLATIALLGYYYTALQFELRLRYTIALALSLVLANAMLFRWLYMARRRLAVSQALEARARKDEGEVQVVTESGTPPVDADKVDIPAVDAQTRQLFKSSITVASVVGLYLVWVSVMPALQGLDRVQLLPSFEVLPADADVAVAVIEPAKPIEVTEVRQTGMVPGLTSSSANSSEAGAGIPSTLTLDDLLIALVLLVLTTVATKNLPALLELSLLQRLPLDGGARYAVSTIVRYLILIVGVGAISNAIGVGWQQVQWLAAALTFGLAFGLQEIFANFVSGLIILFERPIRVGDTVTVAGIEGRVTELRMRATTIQDYDRRELLVPNKEFITGSVVNWSLSDPITRVIVPVGIAYGSDTAKAKELLMSAATGASLVLSDPPPQVVFRAFGASSLDFELRVFLPNRDIWAPATDQLHTSIDALFRSAGIVIAFPQMDVHVQPTPE